MEDTPNRPNALEAIWQETKEAEFTMPSDHLTGALLRTLAASRFHSRLLELGTGTGLSAAWILDGMDSESTLDSVDSDAAVAAVAQRHLGSDSRLRLHVQDGAEFLSAIEPSYYDFIFADAWPGKYTHFDLAIGALKRGGLYIVDDMLPQSNWPDGHAAKAAKFCETIEARRDLQIVKLNWSTGLIVAAKVG